jgi:hypothetical protein
MLKHKSSILPQLAAGIDSKCLMFGRAKMTLFSVQKDHVLQRGDVRPELLYGWADAFLNDYRFDWVGSLDYSDFEGSGFTWTLNMPLVSPIGSDCRSFIIG